MKRRFKFLIAIAIAVICVTAVWVVNREIPFEKSARDASATATSLPSSRSALVVSNAPTKLKWHATIRHGTGCNGVIVATDWVLTAAHCVEGIAMTDWAARAATNAREVMRPRPLIVIINAVNIEISTCMRPIIPTEYCAKCSPSPFDVALIHLPLTLTDKIKSIKAVDETEEANYLNKSVFVVNNPNPSAGGGSSVGSTEIHLEPVRLESGILCPDLYLCGGNFSFVDNESGGALTTKDDDSAALLGVTSFSVAKEGPGFKDRDKFSRIVRHSNWMWKVINDQNRFTPVACP